jgi:hypothetical protein
MLILKDSSVVYAGLCPEMYYALGVASALKQQLFGMNMVITSMVDGHHNDGSLHPEGRAADVRDEDLKPTERITWFNAIKNALEPMGFDVVSEKVGSTPETTAVHLHIEYDPHGRKFWN